MYHHSGRSVPTEEEGTHEHRSMSNVDQYTLWGYTGHMGTATWRSQEQSRNHTKHWAQPQDGALTYAALGDSAGVGVGVDDPAQGYVGVIANRLAEMTGETIRLVNLSVSGAMVALPIAKPERA